MSERILTENYLDLYSENDYRAYLIHHGIPGQRWGVRRYQNSDGSLTTSGKKRYSRLSGKIEKANTRIGKLEAKKSSPSYLKKQAKIQKVQNKLDARKIKNQKIRDEKDFYMKDPSFLGRMSLKKELKLSKKLYRLNKKNRVLDAKIYKTNARINKYKNMLDKMTA